MVKKGVGDMLYRFGLIMVIFLAHFHLPVANAKFVLLSITIVIISLVSLRSKSLLKVEFNVSQLFFSLFIVWSALSVFWSLDSGLALYHLMGWIVILLFAFSIPHLIYTEVISHSWLSLCLISVFTFSFIQNIAGVQLGYNFSVTWNQFLFNNSNYTSSHLVSLLPFVLFFPFKNVLLRFMKFVTVVLLINFLFVMEARGAFVAATAVVLMYYLLRPSTKFKKQFIWSAGAVFLIAIIYLGWSDQSFSIPIVESYLEDKESRFYQVASSAKLTLSNLIFGMGFGNWMIEAYSFNLDQVNPFNNVLNQVRFRFHNLYFSLAAELGILGVSFFITPFILIIQKAVRNFSNLSSFHYACLGSILTYLICSIFYGIVNIHEYHFSSIQLIGFISLAILSDKLYKKPINLSRKFGFGLIVIGIITSCYFLWSRSNFVHFKKGQELIANNLHERAIETFESRYNPFFNSSFNSYYTYPQLIANSHDKLGDKAKAIAWYKEAIALRPYDLETHLDYCNLLLDSNNDAALVIELLTKFLDIHPSYCRLNILLTKAYLQNNEIVKAKDYFNLVDVKCSSKFQSEIEELNNLTAN